MSRKEEIIYATLELASAKGMQGVSMSQIADKVGIKAPSLYNHFKSKDEIIQEMYRFLRENAQKSNGELNVDFAESLSKKSLEDILMGSLSAYIDRKSVV